MKPFVVKKVSRLRGAINLLGDKSIAHRSIIAAGLACGKTSIENFPANKDCLYTLSAFQKLGLKIKKQAIDHGMNITVFGKGLKALNRPLGHIFVGDSGTTLRLMLGVLAGQDFSVTLKGGESISCRPMRRVTVPLRKMGAFISARRTTHDAQREEYLPITIKGARLKPITYKMPVASAQVKSAILLAGLNAKGLTKVIEPVKTRDHTERMLKLFKADIKINGNVVAIKGNKELVTPGKIYIPADISSASFFIVAALLCPDSEIKIKNVSLNPTRIGALKVLKRMNASIRITHSAQRTAHYEPMGDLIIKSSRLRATTVKKEEVPSLIDELPILMVAASLTKGKTIFEDIGELRVKETDRIRSMSENLKKMGAEMRLFRTKNGESVIIKGVKELRAANVRSFGDHRTAMSMAVAGLIAKGVTKIDDITCINKSFPGFLAVLNKLT